jgi:replicative DNA helicase
LNIQQIRAEARRCKRKFDIKYLMVDYVQLIQAQGYDDFRARVSFVSGQLKACAKELNIPVITLAQVTREAGKDGAMPRLEHLKESGSLEEDADVVILLHREKKHDNEEAIAIIAKQRNGPLGVVRLNFNGPLTRFTERD